MKKMFALLLMVVVLVASFASCASKFTCDMCNKEVEGKKHTVTVEGEKGDLCDDCYKLYKSLEGLMG